MENLNNKINQGMGIRQAWMEEDDQLKRPQVGYDHTRTISKLWSVLSEEDKEYIQCAQDAITEKSTISWKPNGNTTKK